MTLPLATNWQHLLISALRRNEFFIDRNNNSLLMQKTQIIEKLLSQEYNSVANRKAADISFSDNGSNYYQYVDDNYKGKLVAIISLKGDMLKNGTMCSYGTIEIEEFMRQLAANDNCIGAVLDIDSGGGECVSVPPILRGIEEFQKREKLIVAVGDVCCSAAYYMAAKCDYVFADNDRMSVFGSIGVMASWVDIVPYLKKEGYGVHTVYSDLSGDKNKYWEECKEGEYENYKQKMLNPLALNFQEDIKKFRGAKLKADVEGVLTGDTFYVPKAKEVGLIDGVMTVNEAVKFVLEYMNL